MQNQLTIQKTIDTSGTRCPIPLLRAKIALKELKAGDLLKVIATDPSTKSDFDAMLSFLPHELLGYQEGELKQGIRTDVFIIRKG